MSIREENDLMIKSVEWTSRVSQQINKAGGNSVFILHEMPNDLILTMIRNNLDIKYVGGV